MTFKGFIVMLRIVIFMSILLSAHTAFADKSGKAHKSGKGGSAQIDDLQQQIDTIELMPGPQGPAGPQGDSGAEGPQGIQGEQGPRGIDGISSGDIMAPEIILDAPTIVTDPSVAINITITDDIEVAYYVFQDGLSSTNQKMVIIEPNLFIFEQTIERELQLGTNLFLVMRWIEPETIRLLC